LEDRHSRAREDKRRPRRHPGRAAPRRPSMRRSSTRTPATDTCSATARISSGSGIDSRPPWPSSASRARMTGGARPGCGTSRSSPTTSPCRRQARGRRLPDRTEVGPGQRQADGRYRPPRTLPTTKRSNTRIRAPATSSATAEPSSVSGIGPRPRLRWNGSLATTPAGRQHGAATRRSRRTTRRSRSGARADLADRAGPEGRAPRAVHRVAPVAQTARAMTRRVRPKAVRAPHRGRDPARLRPDYGTTLRPTRSGATAPTAPPTTPQPSASRPVRIKSGPSLIHVPGAGAG
jgi:hypothetical protein